MAHQNMTTVLAGYDGSPASSAAIDAAGRLLPGARATIAYFWGPPFADSHLRRRLWRRAENLEQLMSLVEREGAAEAERLAAEGALLAGAAGWNAEPAVRRGYGGTGYELARMAEELAADILFLGARGLGGIHAVLGSTSDLTVHVSTVPVMVVPHPLLTDEREAAAEGPVTVAYDGSAGARTALEAAAHLFPDRRLIVVTVNDREDEANEAADQAALETAGAERAEVVTVERDRGGGDSVSAVVARCAAELQAGVVAVGSRGRSATP